jgi:hypothetical protein
MGALPLAAPLASAAEAGRIGRSWTRIQVPGHWQCVAAFAAYEGLMLYPCRFGYRLPLGDGMISLRFGCLLLDAGVADRRLARGA